MSYVIKTFTARHYCANVYVIMPIFSSLVGCYERSTESIRIVYEDGRQEVLNNVLHYNVI